MADDPVIQTIPLGFQWATVDPFLFCVHHLDQYPKANEHFGPAASLEARDIGQDFAGTDGWRMYHGSIVPGFPQHPHRGFETVTFVRRGYIDHSDSLGATARFGRGDVQWLTAGEGIVHCEMFPLLDRENENPVELFQIWLNLPAADKMVEPYFTMLWDDDIPRLVATDDVRPHHRGHGRGRAAGRAHASCTAARARGPRSPSPTWRSGTSSPRPTPPGTSRRPTVPTPSARSTCSKAPCGSASTTSRRRPARCCAATSRSTITAGHDGAEALVLQGRPIGEPVAQYGPFVMNDDAGIEQAFADYRETGFGGWPWPTDDPVHGRDAGRFARHAGRSGRARRPGAEPALGTNELPATTDRLRVPVGRDGKP